jgi:hypothetical protein
MCADFESFLSHGRVFTVNNYHLKISQQNKLSIACKIPTKGFFIRVKQMPQLLDVSKLCQKLYGLKNNSHDSPYNSFT